MSATKPSPTASHAPSASPSGSGGIMSSLYRLRIGPLQTAYYQRHFDRFEALGRATPSWNLSAASFTLAWLLLRQMYRPAIAYAACLLAFLLLWWFGVHGSVARPLEAAFFGIGALVLCLVPGVMGNALYYHHVRSQTLAALNASPNLAQAQRKLQGNPVHKDRLHLTIAAQTVASLVMAGLLLGQTNWSDVRWSAAPAAPPSGPPDLDIPSVADLASIPPLPDLPAFTPDTALPATPAPAAEAAREEAPADLSIVTLAQSLAPPDSPSTGHSASAAALVAPAKATLPAAPPAKAAATTPPAPAAKPAPPATPRAVPAASGLVPGKFYVNAGVYAQAANVDRAVKTLQTAQLPVLRQTMSSNKGELTRLRIGPFDTRAQADAALARAKLLHLEASVFQHPLR